MPDTPLRIVQSIASIGPAKGGPARTVPALHDALVRAGVGSRLLSTETCTPTSLPAALRREVRAGRLDLLHDHGVWLYTNHLAARRARAAGVPRIVSTRGMLSPWALGYRSLKKRLAWSLYQQDDLRTAAVLHVTSPQEGADVRELGLDQPIAVIPNGVQVPPLVQRNAAQIGRRQALFLSRIHPVKGVLNLITAWSVARPENWELVIVGPAEPSHRREVLRAIDDHDLSASVALRDEVTESDKWTLHQRADLFVLPSFSESFGAAIAEALAVGVPVIATRGAPWAVLSEQACGWWIDIGVRPLVEAIREATAMTDAQRRAMGSRGRAYVSHHLSWDTIARDMTATYSWMVGRGARPACVEHPDAS